MVLDEFILFLSSVMISCYQKKHNTRKMSSKASSSSMHIVLMLFVHAVMVLLLNISQLLYFVKTWFGTLRRKLNLTACVVDCGFG